MPAFSHIENLCQGFVPANNLYIPAGLYSSGGISEDQFNQIMDRIEKIYAPEFEPSESFQVSREWMNGTVNAYATRFDNVRVIIMFGGLARHKAIGVEGMAYVACHEVGHHLGGSPKRQAGDWSVTEGGADYFATLKCLRRFFAEDDNEAVIAKLKLDPTAKAGCEAQFSDKKDQMICLRSSEAARQASELFDDLARSVKSAQYDTPETNEVPNTILFSYPSNQCRLDTMLAGMLCQVSVNDRLSETDYKQGSCYTPRDSVGFRPRCWFAP